MDIALEEVVEAWALHNCPALLCHPDVLTGLILLIHKILMAAVQTERAATFARLLKVHPC